MATHQGPERDVPPRMARLHTRQAGDGPAVLLLHAFPLNARMWQPQLDGLRSRARLVAPDLPGFGLTPPPGDTPSLDDYGHGVLDVLDTLGIDRVVVVGLSMGGYVAFRLIEPLGPRLAGLLLADTRATADDAASMVRRHALAAEVEATGVEAAAAEFLPKLLGATTQRTRPALIDHVHELVRENTPAGLAGALRAMASRPDSTRLLGLIRCPVVCLAGDEDVVTPPDVVREMAAQIPTGRFRLVSCAGHLTNLEAAEAFNGALAELLGDAGAVRSA